MVAWTYTRNRAHQQGVAITAKQGAGTSLADTRQTAGTVLVVEDDASNRALLTHLLEREGFFVLAIADGREAVEAVATAGPDLVVLDVGLPGIDGFELTRRLRLDPAYATLPILLLTGRSDPADVITGLDAGADDFITKPFSQPELIARIRSALRLRHALVGMEAAHSVVAALANAVEAKDEQTEHHCERLALFAGRLGMRIGLDRAELDAVTFGALLHDVGKIGVPDHVLTKPGPLDDDEWELIRRHPEIGERICAPLRSFAAFGPIIRHHHERWDGQGYPEGMRGEQIPIGARIVGLVDAFDAITHDRPYRPARTLDQALEELAGHGGRQFDPDLTALFADEVQRLSGQASTGALDSFDLLARRLRPAGLADPFAARRA
jgi:putative two-component system response regulator